MSLRRRWIIILTLLVSACSDSSPRGNKAARPVSDFDTFTVEQTACLFDCPAFEVNIRSDGLITHSGLTFDYTGGNAKSRADPPGLAKIAKALQVARIDEMRDSYQGEADGCEDLMSDMSTLILTVRWEQGAREKRVVLYTGCVGPTVPAERIGTLINTIDSVTGTGALLEQRKRVKPLEFAPISLGNPTPSGTP